MYRVSLAVNMQSWLDRDHPCRNRDSNWEQIRMLSQQSAPGRNERVVTHLNVSARIRSYQIGNPNRGDRTQTQGSYLIGRFYRNRSAHLKMTNRDQAHQILSDRMDSQSLVS